MSRQEPQSRKAEGLLSFYDHLMTWKIFIGVCMALACVGAAWLGITLSIWLFLRYG